MEIPPLTVAVESAIHNALAETVERICDEYQIKVESVSIEWTWGYTCGDGHRYRVKLLELRTVKTF